jgi:hypothetical protein
MRVTHKQAGVAAQWFRKKKAPYLTGGFFFNNFSFE